MLRQKSGKRRSFARNTTPRKQKNSSTKKSPSKSPLKTGRNNKNKKKKENIMKVVFNWIKRNENRMNLAQKSIFSNLISEKIMDNSSGIYRKLGRAIDTYNERLKKELINHVNLKLKIACIERGVFTEGDFEKNIVSF